GELHAVADLNADRQHRAVAAGRARRPQRLVEEVLELGPAAFEARRSDVRDLVRDGVDLRLLRLHAGRGGEQCPHQRMPSIRFRVGSSSICIARRFTSNARWISTRLASSFAGWTFEPSMDSGMSRGDTSGVPASDSDARKRLSPARVRPWTASTSTSLSRPRTLPLRSPTSP